MGSFAAQILHSDPLTTTLLGVAVIVLASLACGQLFRRLGQPAVVGEIVAGILLGPSVLGDASEHLFPLASRPMLDMLATLGLVTFMFLVGLDLDVAHLRSRTRVAAAVSLTGTAIPFVLGVGASLALHDAHAPAVGAVPFALFLGASMSITAFPVLARILAERGLSDTPLGTVALTCAAADDVMTWVTVALVIAIVTSSGLLGLPLTIALALAFVVLVVRVVAPQLRSFAGRPADPTALALTLAGLLLSAVATAAIGVHEVFGAFLFGAAFPRGRLRDEIRVQVRSLSDVLLPVFFVVTGLQVHLEALDASSLAPLALILVVACTGKITGGALGARLDGVPTREAVALGVLMNCRGLTELVVLSIGHELGVLDQELFTILVVMAVLTTVVTGPLLTLIRPDADLTRRDAAVVGRPAPVGTLS